MDCAVILRSPYADRAAVQQRRQRGRWPKSIARLDDARLGIWPKGSPRAIEQEIALLQRQIGLMLGTLDFAREQLALKTQRLHKMRGGASAGVLHPERER